MTAGGGYFQGAFDIFLSFDFRKIELVVMVIVEQRADIHLRRGDFYFAFEESRRLA